MPSVLHCQCSLFGNVTTFLSSRRSALCVRLSLSSFESLSMNISRCRKSRILHQLLPGLLAEPMRPEERSVRVRARIQDHTVCPQQSHQFIRPVQTSIQLDWITTFVRTLYYNVTDISSPRCVCTSRLQTSSTQRPPALSGTKLYSNTRKRSRNKLRIPHVTITYLYTV